MAGVLEGIVCTVDVFAIADVAEADVLVTLPVADDVQALVVVAICLAQVANVIAVVQAHMYVVVVHVIAVVLVHMHAVLAIALLVVTVVVN